MEEGNGGPVELSKPSSAHKRGADLAQRSQDGSDSSFRRSEAGAAVLRA